MSQLAELWPCMSGTAQQDCPWPLLSQEVLSGAGGSGRDKSCPKHLTNLSQLRHLRHTSTDLLCDSRGSSVRPRLGWHRPQLRGTSGTGACRPTAVPSQAARAAITLTGVVCRGDRGP